MYSSHSGSQLRQFAHPFDDILARRKIVACLRQQAAMWGKACQFWAAAVGLASGICIADKSGTVLSGTYSQPMHPDQMAKIAFAGSVSKSTWVLLTSWDQVSCCVNAGGVQG